MSRDLRRKATPAPAQVTRPPTTSQARRGQAETTLQRAAVNPAPLDAVPETVDDALAAPGRQLDPATRAYMEPRFGHDFSQVRIHTDAQAAESARMINARAYTVGDDIAFNAPQHQPAGELLAHELAHVVQQRQGGAGADAEPRAKAVARQVGQGTAVAPAQVGGAPAGVQRAGDESDVATTPAGATTSAAANRLSLNLATLDRFALNSAALTDDHRAQIAELAGTLLSMLVQLPGASVTLTGHTDATGGEGYNKELGQRRAEAVRDALVKAGVPAGSIAMESAGESRLRVPTAGAEPRNRRVEVRMEGPSLTLMPSAALRSRGVTSDQPRKPDLTPPVTPPTTLTPPSVLPPASTTAPPRTETPPRAGKAGDVVKAILGLDPVKKAVDTFVNTQKTQFDKKLSPGEKAAVATTVVTIGAGALAGIWSDPAARKEALGLVNGQEVPVPGVPGLKVQVLTQPGGGAVLKLDLTKIVPQLK